MSTLNSLMKDRMLILASASPRRQQLVSGLDIQYIVEIPNHNEESFDSSMPFENVPEYLAKMKSESFGRNLEDNEILLTADTLVLCDGKILGKPIDRDDAIFMLRSLSGKKHTVITGVFIKSNFGYTQFSSSTDVFFRELSNDEIIFYVDNYSPYDKAGSYGAQEWIGYIAIEKIEGSYFNVMGLPVQKLYRELVLFIEKGYSFPEKF
ncbi:MAG: Maf family nucleotide pyrophosphatase [Bacteroidales bacterium]|nr:Maf family nucleotide pyrophosphatase [Bacteroidales bacterium]